MDRDLVLLQHANALPKTVNAAAVFRYLILVAA